MKSFERATMSESRARARRRTCFGGVCRPRGYRGDASDGRGDLTVPRGRAFHRHRAAITAGTFDVLGTIHGFVAIFGDGRVGTSCRWASPAGVTRRLERARPSIHHTNPPRARGATSHAPCLAPTLDSSLTAMRRLWRHRWRRLEAPLGRLAASQPLRLGRLGQAACAGDPALFPRAAGDQGATGERR